MNSDFQNLEVEKENLSLRIKIIKNDVNCLKVLHEDENKKLESASNLQNEKLHALNRESEMLCNLVNDKNVISKRIDDLKVKLKSKGESRLTAFQRPLEKEELKKAEIKYEDISLKILEQQIVLDNMEDNLKVARKETINRGIELRNKTKSVKEGSKKLCQLNENLININEKLLREKDTINSFKLSISEIESDFNYTKRELRGETKTTAYVNLHDVREMLATKIGKEKQVRKYFF